MHTLRFSLFFTRFIFSSEFACFDEFYIRTMQCLYVIFKIEIDRSRKKKIVMWEPIHHKANVICVARRIWSDWKAKKCVKMMANVKQKWKKNTRQIWQSKVMDWTTNRWRMRTKHGLTQQSRGRMEKRGEREKKTMICQKWHLPMDWRKFVCVMEKCAYCAENNNSYQSSNRSTNESNTAKFQNRLSFDPKNPVESRICSSQKRTNLRFRVRSSLYLLWQFPLLVQCVYHFQNDNDINDSIMCLFFAFRGMCACFLIDWLVDCFFLHLLLLLLRWCFFSMEL